MVKYEHKVAETNDNRNGRQTIIRHWARYDQIKINIDMYEELEGHIIWLRKKIIRLVCILVEDRWKL